MAGRGQTCQGCHRLEGSAFSVSFDVYFGSWEKKLSPGSFLQDEQTKVMFWRLSSSLHFDLQFTCRQTLYANFNHKCPRACACVCVERSWGESQHWTMSTAGISTVEERSVDGAFPVSEIYLQRRFGDLTALRVCLTSVENATNVRTSRFDLCHSGIIQLHLHFCGLWAFCSS